jgi:protein gp37
MFEQLKRYGRDPCVVHRTKTWGDPQRWNEQARRGGRTERVFTCSLSDFFHEGADAWRPEAWAVIRRCPHLEFQILTKRPLRIADHLPPDWGEGYPNVWLGVSIESNDYCWRADVLRQIPVRVRWISAEPLLGPLPDLDLTGIHWIVVGGESGPGYRDMDHAWARQIRNFAHAQGAAFYFKQSAGPRPGKGDLLDGRRWREFPRTPDVADSPAREGRPLADQAQPTRSQAEQGRGAELPRAGKHKRQPHQRHRADAEAQRGESAAGEAEQIAPVTVVWSRRKIRRRIIRADDCAHWDLVERYWLQPTLVQEKREGGRVVHEKVADLPRIRTCCLDDLMIRAGWWHEVISILQRVRDHGTPPVGPAGSCQDWRGQVEASLASKVAMPTAEEWKAFQGRTVEQMRRREEYSQRERAEWQRAEQERQRQEKLRRAEQERLEAEQRAREAEERRQQQESDERWRAWMEEMERIVQESEELLRDIRRRWGVRGSATPAVCPWHLLEPLSAGADLARYAGGPEKRLPRGGDEAPSRPRRQGRGLHQDEGGLRRDQGGARLVKQGLASRPRLAPRN